MEIMAARQELVLGDTDHMSSRVVDVEENVNDAIIESIKAKLALLDDIV
jgi:hypothetical protein